MKDWKGKPFLALLAGKEEDRFTAFLCELLKAPFVLREFLEQVCNIDVAEPEKFIVATQVVVEGSRPDIVIKSDSALYIFEAKVSSWLHEGQLEQYAGYLLGQAKSIQNYCLFMICPENSMTSAEKDGEELKIDKNHYKVISWEGIRRLFDSIEPAIGDPNLSIHLSAFSDLVKQRFGESLKSYTSEQIHLLSDSQAGLVLYTVFTAMKLLCETLLNFTNNEAEISTSPGIEYGGYWIRYKGRKWWFGVWPEVWKNLGQSPLFFQLTGRIDEQLNLHDDSVPMPHITTLSSKQVATVVPLTFSSDVQLSEIVKDFANTIIYYCKNHPESGSIYL
jgi:hypothetical protein